MVRNIIYVVYNIVYEGGPKSNLRLAISKTYKIILLYAS